MTKLSKTTFIILGLLLSLCILALVVKTGITQNIDYQISLLVMRFHPSWWDFIMKAISWPGYPPQTFILYIAWILLFLLFIGKKAALLGAIGLQGASGLGYLLKFWLNRSRPEHFGITPWHLGLEGGVKSFPAGHIQAFAYLGLLTIFWIKNKYLRYLLFVLVLIMGVSRIYLGEHWFTDVIAGYLVSFIWVLLISYLNENISHLQSQGWKQKGATSRP